MATISIPQKNISWEFQINLLDEYGDITDCDHVDATADNAIQQIKNHALIDADCEWKNSVELLVQYTCTKSGECFHTYVNPEQKKVYIGSTYFDTYVSTIPAHIMKVYQLLK